MHVVTCSYVCIIGMYPGCCRFPISVFRFPISGHFRDRNSDFRFPVFFRGIGIPISVFRFFGSKIGKIGTEFCSHNVQKFFARAFGARISTLYYFQIIVFPVSRTRSSLKSSKFMFEFYFLLREFYFLLFLIFIWFRLGSNTVEFTFELEKLEVFVRVRQC